MKILVCDDELIFLEEMKDYLKKLSKETKIPISGVFCEDGKTALSYFRRNRDIDLFILDIKMKGMSGLEIAEKIRQETEDVKIVFLTSVFQEAAKGYELGVSLFWLKPLSYEKFHRGLQGIYEKIQRESCLYLMEDVGDVIERIYFEHILYIATIDRKVYLYTKNKKYRGKRTLKEYERILDKRFFRCHAGYIVNMDYIGKICGEEIFLITEDKVYISRQKRKEFIKVYGEYLGTKNIGVQF